MDALNIEKEGFKWFKNHIDKNAEYYGGSDSYVSDIYSPKLNGWIEVKDLTTGARCGQFVQSTASLYPEAMEVLQGNCTEENAKTFVKSWYTNKNVINFLIYKNNQFNLYNIEDFLNSFSFGWQNPYNKRSGTRSLPKKDFSYVQTLIPSIYWDNDMNKAFVNDNDLIGKYFYHINELDSYFISKNKEVRKRARPNESLTWHAIVK